jgi:hypothetical protein
LSQAIELSLGSFFALFTPQPNKHSRQLSGRLPVQRPPGIWCFFEIAFVLMYFRSVCQRHVFLSRQGSLGLIRSYEHESIFTASLGANIVQAKWRTSTDGAELMDSANQAMMAALRSIRDQADSVLKQIERPQEKHSMRWKCKACRYTKYFTKLVPLESAGRCRGVNVRSLDRPCELSLLCILLLPPGNSSFRFRSVLCRIARFCSEKFSDRRK